MSCSLMPLDGCVDAELAEYKQVHRCSSAPFPLGATTAPLDKRTSERG